MTADTQALDQAQLQGLVRARAVFELVATPVNDSAEPGWVLNIVLANGERLTLSKTREKGRRRVWKQLSAVHRFLQSTVPEVERFTVATQVVED